MNNFKQDLRYAFRLMAKSPGFTVVAVLALALGIGANTAIFSVVNSALLRSLPYPDADRLVALFHTYPAIHLDRASVDPVTFIEHRREFKSFESLAAFTGFQSPRNLSTGNGLPESVTSILVTEDFFKVLGVSPAIGRAFAPEESQPGRNQVAILTHAIWQKRFGGSRDVIGEKIQLDGKPYEIVGVMEQGYDFPPKAEVLLPFPYTPQFTDPNGMGGVEFLMVIGKLKPGVTLGQVQAEAESRAASIREQNNLDANVFALTTISLQEFAVGPMRAALWVLLGAVALVLLIACVNIANLLLARGSARQKEIAVRAALGASRSRLVRQLLTESIVLALVGGCLGLFLGYWGVDLLMAMAPSQVTQFLKVTVDQNVLWFTLGVSLLTGLIFGLVPAFHSSDPNLNEQLGATGRTSGAAFGRGGIRGALIAGEVALAIVLLIGAGLLIRSFDRLRDVDPGFRSDNLISLRLVLPDWKYAQPAQRVQFVRDLEDQVRALPGVESVGLTSLLPLTGASSGSFRIEGQDLPPNAALPHGNTSIVTPSYMNTMGMMVVRGRGFEPNEGLGTPDVVVVDERIVERFFPEGDAIGKRVSFGGDVLPDGQRRWREIVGIVRPVRNESLKGEVRGTVYTPYGQNSPRSLALVARTRTDPEALTNTLRSLVAQIDPDQAISQVRSMSSLMDESESLAQSRFSTQLLGAFAAVALLLASLGLYGVMSYSVSRRTQEIGIRMALGAGTGDVLRLVISQGMKLVMAGVVVGLLLAFGVTRFLQSLLFGVGALDPLTFIVIPLVLSGVALLAAYIPARFAASVNPTAALRYE